MPVTSRESQPKSSFVTFASWVGARPNINFTCQPVSSSNFMVILWDDNGHLTLLQPATKFKAVFFCSWETVWLFLFCWAVEFSVVFWSFSCWYRFSYLHNRLDAPFFSKWTHFFRWKDSIITLPETKRSPWKWMVASDEMFLLGFGPFFRGKLTVSFRVEEKKLNSIFTTCITRPPVINYKWCFCGPYHRYLFDPQLPIYVFSVTF